MIECTPLQPDIGGVNFLDSHIMEEPKRESVLPIEDLKDV